MAISNWASTFEEALQDFKTVFEETLELDPFLSMLPAYEMEVGMKSKSLQYNILRDYVEFKKWVGERNLADIEADKINIVAEPWEAGLEFDRHDIEDDNLGNLMTRVKSFARAYGKLRMKRMAEILTGAVDLGNGYDGVPLFSASHSLGDSGNQSNTGTLDLSGPNFDTTRKLMRQYKDHKGDPLLIRPDTIMVGSELEATADALFNQPYEAGGANNPYYKKVNVVVNDWLFDSDNWFLFDTSKDLKPIIFGNRYQGENVRYTSLGLDSDTSVLQRKLYWGAETRFGYAVGFPLLVFKQNPT